MAKTNWIASAIGRPGALHAQLGVPQGQSIPAAKLRDAIAGRYGALAKRRALLARTLSKFNRK